MQTDRSDMLLNAALTRAGRAQSRESFDMRAELEALLRATAAPQASKGPYQGHKAA